MWFIFSLVTIFAWGGSNLLQKMGTNPKDENSHWKIIVFVGFVMGLHAIGYMIFKDYHFDFFNMIKYFPVSLLYIVSMGASYVGLRYMDLSILAPVCNSSGAVTAILCFFILGQPLTSLQLFGIVVVCIGIFLVSYFEKREDDKRLRAEGTVIEKKYTHGLMALIFPLTYCVLDGLGSFADALYLQYYISEQDALLSYEFTFLIAGIFAFIYVKYIKKSKFVFAEDRLKGLGGVCEMIGQFTYVFAMSSNAVVAAPLIASYCVISVLMSRLVLKERLTRLQYAAIMIVMIGIAVLGIE
ncbi:MAG: EamA family transporter [Anaerovoracaceae bacterium]